MVSPLVGAIAVPADRLVKVVPGGGTVTAQTGIPAGSYLWPLVFDPSDRNAYAIDWSGLLADAEEIVAIDRITLSAAAATIGLSVDASAGRLPLISSDGKLVQLWFDVLDVNEQLSSFNSGIDVGIAVQVRTDAIPYRELERTVVLRVRQQ